MAPDVVIAPLEIVPIFVRFLLVSKTTVFATAKTAVPETCVSPPPIFIAPVGPILSLVTSPFTLK